MLKLITTLLLILFSFFEIYGQQLIKQNFDRNFYLGFNNYVILNSSEFSCDSIILKATNSIVYKGSAECEYMIFPHKHKENTSVFIYNISDNDTVEIFREVFNISDKLKIYSEVGGMKGGVIKKSRFSVQQGIIASLDNPYHHFLGDIRFSIISFSTLILRDNTCIYTETSLGPSFSDKLKNELSKLQSKDKVIFHSISVKGSDGKHRKTSALEFEIGE